MPVASVTSNFGIHHVHQPVERQTGLKHEEREIAQKLLSVSRSNQQRSVAGKEQSRWEKMSSRLGSWAWGGTSVENDIEAQAGDKQPLRTGEAEQYRSEAVKRSSGDSHTTLSSGAKMGAIVTGSLLVSGVAAYASYRILSGYNSNDIKSLSNLESHNPITPFSNNAVFSTLSAAHVKSPDLKLDNENINFPLGGKSKRTLSYDEYLDSYIDKIKCSRIKQALQESVDIYRTSGVPTLQEMKESNFVMNVLHQVRYLNGLITSKSRTFSHNEIREIKGIIINWWDMAHAIDSNGKNQQQFARTEKEIISVLNEYSTTSSITRSPASTFFFNPLTGAPMSRDVTETIKQNYINSTTDINAYMQQRFQNILDHVENKVVKNKLMSIIRGLGNNRIVTTQRTEAAREYAALLEIEIGIRKFFIKNMHSLSPSDFNAGKMLLDEIDNKIDSFKEQNISPVLNTNRLAKYQEMRLTFQMYRKLNEKLPVVIPRVTLKKDYSNAGKYLAQLHHGIKNQKIKEKFHSFIELSTKMTKHMKTDKYNKKSLFMMWSAKKLMAFLRKNKDTLSLAELDTGLGTVAVIVYQIEITPFPERYSWLFKDLATQYLDIRHWRQGVE